MLITFCCFDIISISLKLNLCSYISYKEVLFQLATHLLLTLLEDSHPLCQRLTTKGIILLILSSKDLSCPNTLLLSPFHCFEFFLVTNLMESICFAVQRLASDELKVHRFSALRKSPTDCIMQTMYSNSWLTILNALEI